jgi:hypothetical protein
MDLSSVRVESQVGECCLERSAFFIRKWSSLIVVRRKRLRAKVSRVLQVRPCLDRSFRSQCANAYVALTKGFPLMALMPLRFASAHLFLAASESFFLPASVRCLVLGSLAITGGASFAALGDAC